MQQVLKKDAPQEVKDRDLNTHGKHYSIATVSKSNIGVKDYGFHFETDTNTVAIQGTPTTQPYIVLGSQKIKRPALDLLSDYSPKIVKAKSAGTQLDELNLSNTRYLRERFNELLHDTLEGRDFVPTDELVRHIQNDDATCLLSESQIRNRLSRSKTCTVVRGRKGYKLSK